MWPGYFNFKQRRSSKKRKGNDKNDANYPYLTGVGEDIINYRLKNRNASSKEVLDNVLNNLKKKNKRKKKLPE